MRCMIVSRAMLGEATVALLRVFTPVLLPEFPDELRHGDGVGVVADQSQHEHSVLPQIVLHEGIEVPPVVVLDVDRVLVVFILHQVDVLLDVPPSVGVEHRAEGPRDETQAGESGEEHHPEPQKQVDLLVEQVDREDALHRVALHVAESPHLQVAHRDPRETLRLGPIIPTKQLLDDIDPVHVVVRPQERVQHEQLADDVDDEEDLCDQIEGDQVVALAAAAHDAQSAREAVLYTVRKLGLVSALGPQIPGT